MEARDDKRARRPRREAARRPDARKVKRTLGLSAEASRRLDCEALGTGRTAGDVVDELVRRHCRRFVLTDRGGGDGHAIGPEGQGIGPGQE